MEVDTEPLVPAEDDQSQRSSMASNIHPVPNIRRPYKVYRRRWIMLFIFFLYSMANAAQWIEYSIISNVIQRYYGQTGLMVDMTSTIYMITFPFLIYPASLLLDKMGLRTFLIIGAFGTALGAWIKCASVAPDRFWVLFLGQTIVATSQVCILGIPPHLASVWFGSDQVSTACSLAFFGNQVGAAIGFILPPLLVGNHATEQDVESDLRLMNYVVAAFCSLVFLIVVLAFQGKPPLPPSLEMLRRQSETPTWLEPLKRLFKNGGYIALALAFSINVAVFSALSTLLNQLMILYFDNGQVVAGVVGLIFIASGLLGSLVCGVILDKTHRFKETAVTLYSVSTLAMIGLTFVLSTRSVWAVYGVSTIVGSFTTAVMPVGFEFATELTYPESESISAGLMTGGSQLLGVLVTLGYARLMDVVGDIWANLCLSFMLILGILCTILIPPRYRRQAVHAAALKETEEVVAPINA